LSLEPGTVLAHYTIHEQIGVGGMGEVYRATDGKLGRDVAVKMLPREVAGDPDRLARFRREAQLLASLNHPNIAAIYGIEEAGGTHILVLEMIEGEDLAARLRRGHVPLDEALAIARQIAEGLEDAHEHGVVHRDLKPANIKLTPSGSVKILDFGLAKAFEPATMESGDQSLSPTLTIAATRAGVIMGTAAYMSPEQARGASVDKRSDIWAFGCVLLEMVSGAKTFGGDTISDTLASILMSDPDWSALPADAGPALRRLLRRCLQKDRRKRLRDIGEARLVLEEILAGAPEEEPEAPVQTPSPRSGRRGLVILAVVLVTAAATAGVMVALRPASGHGPLQKYEFTWPGGVLDEAHAPALSPDGGRILFSTSAGLWIRSLGDLDARLLAGTESAANPFWSPDGSVVGFQRKGALWKIPATGGQVSTIVSGLGDFGSGGGTSWGEDGRIVYADGSGGISDVASLGGDPRSLAMPDLEIVQDLHQPSALPGGKGILYVAHRMATTNDTLSVLVNGESRILLQIEGQGIRTPTYSPTGHILYRRTSGNIGLWAVPFSLARLEITGEPFFVTRDGTVPSVGSDGTLLYAWMANSAQHQLVWLDREGKEVEAASAVMADIMSPALSPDGKRVAVMAQENEAWDIWVLDLERETRMRLTFTQVMDWDPAWTPDGRNVLFWEGGTRDISMKSADGTGEIARVVGEEYPDSGIPSSSPDGKHLVFWVRNADTKEDIYVMPLEGDGKPAELIRTPFPEDEPAISPDGAYLAYMSEESGQREIYLTSFPGGEGKWQVSAKGGAIARWDPRGGRLYFLAGTDLMELEVTTDPVLRLGTPRKLFSISSLGNEGALTNRFCVAPDGQRFLFVKAIKQEGDQPRLVLVRNWLREFTHGD